MKWTKVALYKVKRPHISADLKLHGLTKNRNRLYAARIIDLVADVNRNVFDFSLTEFAEDAQIACYAGDLRGHYDWHSDVGASEVARRRKLTMVIQLSDPDQYEGGQLQLNPAGQFH